MSLPADLLFRLEHQLELVPRLIEGLGEDALRGRPEPSRWSALEHLAHLARHHEILLSRLERIMSSDQPALDRYRAESDPEWAGWAARSMEETMATLKRLRRDLLARVTALSERDLARTGRHPAFGLMTVPWWLEHFLLHESHHLYGVLVCTRAALAEDPES